MVNMADKAEKFKIAKRLIKGYEIIDITGDISQDGSKEIVKFVKKNITGKDKDVYMNLESARHMNSAALSPLVQMVRELATKKIIIYFMNVNEKIVTLIKVAGLHNFFKLINDEAALIDKIDKENTPN